jgi:hypothetical protein
MQLRLAQGIPPLYRANGITCCRPRCWSNGQFFSAYCGVKHQVVGICWKSGFEWGKCDSRASRPGIHSTEYRFFELGRSDYLFRNLHKVLSPHFVPPADGFRADLAKYIIWVDSGVPDGYQWDFMAQSYENHLLYFASVGCSIYSSYYIDSA